MESVIVQGLALIDRQAEVVDGFGFQLVVKERPVGSTPRSIGRPQIEVDGMRCQGARRASVCPSALAR